MENSVFHFDVAQIVGNGEASRACIWQLVVAHQVKLMVITSYRSRLIGPSHSYIWLSSAGYWMPNSGPDLWCYKGYTFYMNGWICLSLWHLWLDPHNLMERWSKNCKEFIQNSFTKEYVPKTLRFKIPQLSNTKGQPN